MSEHKNREKDTFPSILKVNIKAILYSEKEDFSLKKEWIVFCLLFIIVTVAYVNMFFNTFVWDDIGSLVESPILKHYSSIPGFFLQKTDFFYRPVFLSTLTVINAFFGTHAFIFHVLNFLSHGIISIFVYIIFRKFFRPLIALFLAIVFSVHPANTEAVTWISAFSEISYVLYGVLGLFFAIRYLDTYSKKYLLLTSLFVFLSYLSKESAVIFSTLIIFYSFLFEKNRLKSLLVTQGGIFIIYILVRFGIARATFFDTFEASSVPIQTIHFPDRLLNSPEIIVMYFKTYFFPLTLKIKQYWVVDHMSFDLFFMPLLIILFALSIIGIFGSKVRKNDSSLFQTLLFFLGWVFVWILLHIQILPLTMTFAERWLYLGGIGILGVLGVGIEFFYPKSKKSRAIFLIFALGIVAVLTVRTVIRNTDWRNEYTLYSHDYKKRDNNFSLENDYGRELYKLGKKDEALSHFLRSTQIAPNWWKNWVNLGILYEDRGDYQHAAVAYSHAIKNRPSYSISYERLSRMLFFLRYTDQAYEVVLEGIKNDPTNHSLFMRRALIEYLKKDHKKAQESMEKAYSLNPSKDYKDLLEKIKKNEPVEITQ